MKGGSNDLDQHEIELTAFGSALGAGLLAIIGKVIHDQLRNINRVGVEPNNQVEQNGTPPTTIVSDVDIETGLREPEPIEEGGSALSNTFKKIGNTFRVPKKVTTGFSKLNPMSAPIKNKTTRGLMTKSGEITNKNIVPAIVEIGKPVYDATATTASTMLTGNPYIGKEISDELWKGMVSKKDIDPRKRQTSLLLREVSKEVGKNSAKNVKRGLGGKRLLYKNDSEDQIGIGGRRYKKQLKDN
jgi:hypothetical protein